MNNAEGNATALSIDKLKQMRDLAEGRLAKMTPEEMLRIAKHGAAKMNRIDEDYANSKVDEVFDVFGRLFGERDPLLIPQTDRTKIPMIRWGKLTKLTRDEEYWRQVKITCARGGNLAIKLGKESDHLVSIDIDSDELITNFLASNPEFEKTLRTRGSKGCQFWFWAKGQYPREVRRICVNGNAKGTGEWRGDQLSTI